MSKVRGAIGVIVLTVAVALLGLVLLQRTSGPRGSPLAYTSCTLDGPVRLMDVSHLAPEDTQPVRMHEDVHAAQCEQLGWLRMRLRNLTVGGKLSLEAPGYCAGARARLRRGDEFAITRERMFDDMNGMFSGLADSARVNRALRLSCSEIAGH